MKKISYLILLTGMMAFSCSDLLQEDPMGRLTSFNFWKTLEESDAGVRGIYSWSHTGPNTDATIESILWLSRMTGDLKNLGGNYNGRADFINGTITSFNAALLHMWRGFYQGVSMSNTAIANLENNEALTPDNRDRLLGESKFLRAFMYFHLVQIFGEVPLILEEITGSSEFENGNASIPSIYEAIETDLTDAILLLDGKSTGPGRANVVSARALLSKVYLTRATEPLNDNSRLADAIGLTTAVIDDPSTGLQADYTQVFGVANKHNPEILFGINFDQANSFRNPLMIWNFPSAIRNFVNKDGYRYLQGFGNNPFNDTLANSFEPNDKRMLMAWDRYTDPDTTITFGSVFSTKYYDYDAQGDYRNNNAPLPIIRLADIYLVKAESEARLNGPTTTAYEAINAVRTRAGLNDLQAGLSKEEFLAAVLHERRIELHHEWAHYWFDLKRYGKLISTHKAVFPFSVAKDFMTVMPIPAAEIEVNSNIRQNEGY